MYIIAIKNYTVRPQSLTTVSLDKKFDLSAKYESAKWELQELKKYRNGEATTVALADNEELNGENLNNLKTAVDDLEIADVRRKPKGLGADLKAGKGFAQDEEGIRDLNARGFYVVSTPSGEFETLSENGEVYVAGTGSSSLYRLRDSSGAVFMSGFECDGISGWTAVHPGTSSRRNEEITR